MKAINELNGAVTLSEKEISKILGEIGWPEVINVIGDTFVEEARGNTVSPAKTIFQIEKWNNDYRVMPSYMPMKHPDFVGTKIICACPDNPAKYNRDFIEGIYILNSAKMQQTLMICGATTITAWRTAAATAVAVRELAKKDAKTLGIIGCGLQAYYHIPAITAVRSIEKVYITSRTYESEAKLLNHFRPYPWTAEAMVKSTKKEILEKCDIVITLTPTTEPFIFPQDIPYDGESKKMLICAVGGDSETKLELHPEILTFVDHFCDSYEQVAHTGTVHRALMDGIINRVQLKSLGDYMTGKKNLDDSKNVKLFLSTGVALEDLAMAILIYRAVKGV